MKDKGQIKLQKEENNNGITLVSLVVTIIVLIILAGVSINLTLGEEGIFTMVKRTKENVELAQIEEQERLNALYTELELNTESNGESSGSSYDAIAKLLEFKKAIADAIQEAGGMPPEDPIVADIETFKERIVGEKGIVAEVTKDATATAEDIAKDKTAWVNGNIITGKYENSVNVEYFKGVINDDNNTLEKDIGTYTIKYNGEYMIYAIASSSRYENCNIVINKNNVKMQETELTELDVKINVYSLSLKENDVLQFILKRNGVSHAASAGTIILIRK